MGTFAVVLRQTIVRAVVPIGDKYLKKPSHVYSQFWHITKTLGVSAKVQVNKQLSWKVVQHHTCLHAFDAVRLGYSRFEVPSSTSLVWVLAQEGPFSSQAILFPEGS